jgi:hypothetical protein
MLSGTRIIVPSYQRAFSWDVGSQVNVFLSDLEDYIGSTSVSSYYFGHFLFEERTLDDHSVIYGVIDGQQRLTTIVIFLSALFARLKSLRPLTEVEIESYEDMIKRYSTYRFSTVSYDDTFFREYVIDQIEERTPKLKTSSSKRIAKAYNYFVVQLSSKDDGYLLRMLTAIRGASCTTHIVRNESEAIQMFIFQNNRGKRPSKLEILKAEFMYNIHLYGGESKDQLIEEIKGRFEQIYTSISSIEHKIGEDDILNYTSQVYFNVLGETGTNQITEELTKETPIAFIRSFTRSLTRSFDVLDIFFNKDEKVHMEIHSLIALNRLTIAIPFIIKAYLFDIPKSELCNLCSSLETLILRDGLIKTKADLTKRIEGVYHDFSEKSSSIEPIVDRINWIRNVANESWWWSHWNNAALRNALQGNINPKLARFLLWKYENHLLSESPSVGYSQTRRFDTIEDPHLEHISPQTPPDEVVASGYSVYDEEFVQQYLNCIGNYLLLSGKHNKIIGNHPFIKKYESYIHLEQQKEVRSMSEPCGITWTKDLIRDRKEKIIAFIESHV